MQVAAIWRDFPAEHFDFVYSYAVFQHIPSAEVVFSYLRETVRVLKPGGFARLQINGLPKTAKAYTTWEGVRISGAENPRIHARAGYRAAFADRRGHAIHVDYVAEALDSASGAGVPGPDVRQCLQR